MVVFEDREEVLKEQRSKLESYVQDEPGQSVVLSGGCISAVGDLLGQGSGFAAAFQGYASASCLRFGTSLSEHAVVSRGGTSRLTSLGE